MAQQAQALAASPEDFNPQIPRSQTMTLTSFVLIIIEHLELIGS